MKFLFPLLLLLAGCAEAHPTDFHRYTLRLEFENGGICSGTSVAKDVILSAEHCWSTGRLLTINGQEAYALEMVKDGNDHVLARVTVQFKHWATVAMRPVVGDRLRWSGNAAGERDLYREGYVSRALEDEILIDAHGFGGDSGSGLFDRKGRLVAVLSANKSWRAANGMRLDLVVAWPLAFTSEQWRDIRA